MKLKKLISLDITVACQITLHDNLFGVISLLFTITPLFGTKITDTWSCCTVIHLFSNIYLLYLIFFLQFFIATNIGAEVHNLKCYIMSACRCVCLHVWYEDRELSPWYRELRENAIIQTVSCWWTEVTSRQIVICLTFIIILAECKCEIEDHFPLTVHHYLLRSFPTQLSRFISLSLSLALALPLYLRVHFRSCLMGRFSD